MLSTPNAGGPKTRALGQGGHVLALWGAPDPTAVQESPPAGQLMKHEMRTMSSSKGIFHLHLTAQLNFTLPAAGGKVSINPSEVMLPKGLFKAIYETRHHIKYLSGIHKVLPSLLKWVSSAFIGTLYRLAEASYIQTR